MIERVKMIKSEDMYEFENEINKYMKFENVKDIKFVVDSMYGGRDYYAMVILGE